MPGGKPAALMWCSLRDTHTALMALVQDGWQEGRPNMARQASRRRTPRSRLASRSGSVQPPVAHSVGQVALRPVQGSVSPREATPQPHSQVHLHFVSFVCSSCHMLL